jgi:LacI family transcriptional regulator
MRDVAQAAGVSQTTASYVLGNRGTSTIPEKTKEQVRRAARELGYQPNLLARSLGRQKTETIGLMLSDLKNPFFQAVREEFDKQIAGAGYQMMLDSTAEYGEYHELRNLASWLVDGVLIWTIPDIDAGTFLGDRSKDIPVLYLGHFREDGSDAVAMDLYSAGKQATEHLLERGYRRPCFVSRYPAENFLLPSHLLPGYANNLFPAFQRVCLNAGIKPEVYVLDDPTKIPESGFRAGIEIARRPPSERPDSLICANDWLATFVHNGLLRGGLRVPDDIALIGFDGLPEGACLPCGPLTTFKLPVDELCRAALEIMLKRIGGDRTMPPQQILIPMELNLGETT